MQCMYRGNRLMFSFLCKYHTSIPVHGDKLNMHKSPFRLPAIKSFLDLLAFWCMAETFGCSYLLNTPTISWPLISTTWSRLAFFPHKFPPFFCIFWAQKVAKTGRNPKNAQLSLTLAQPSLQCRKNVLSSRIYTQGLDFGRDQHF